MMNAWFGTSFTVEQIDAAAPGRHGSWLTPEVKAWLREHIHERSLAGTAEGALPGVRDPGEGGPTQFREQQSQARPGQPET